MIPGSEATTRAGVAGGEAPMLRRGAAAAAWIAGSLVTSSPLVAADFGHAELIIDVPRGGAFPSEMLKLRVHSTIRGFVALEDLIQPDLVDLDWKQLGPDAWSYVMEKGLRVNSFERAMAVYAQRSGRITVAPFKHHVTLVDTNGLRAEHELRTNPVTLDIRPLPPDAADWWLPARSLTVTDSWDKRPDRLSLGETARRTVVIEAAGIGIERLPPAPKMRAPGIISFAAPAERSSHVTAEGPLSRVTYRWDIRPVSADAATLPAVEIPWFDTLARRNRIATIPETRISLAGADLRDEETGRVLLSRRFSPMNFCLAAVAAFVWGLGAAWLWRRFGAGGARQVALNKLRRSAYKGDPEAFKTSLLALPSLLDGPDDPKLRSDLAALDRHLFGRERNAPPPLVPLYRSLARRAKAKAEAPRGGGGRLLPLDG